MRGIWRVGARGFVRNGIHGQRQHIQHLPGPEGSKEGDQTFLKYDYYFGTGTIQQSSTSLPTYLHHTTTNRLKQSTPTTFQNSSFTTVPSLAEEDRLDVVSIWIKHIRRIVLFRILRSHPRRAITSRTLLPTIQNISPHPEKPTTPSAGERDQPTKHRHATRPHSPYSPPQTQHGSPKSSPSQQGL